MKVGDLIMYMGHLGIILDSVLDTSNHWQVWFFNSETRPGATGAFQWFTAHLYHVLWVAWHK